MNEWGLVRIDDRLLHGQIVAVWVNYLNLKRIVILDDLLSEDDFLKQITKMAAPPELEVLVLSLSEVGQTKELTDPQNTMILLRSPEQAKQAVINGLACNKINLGAQGMSPGRIQFYKSISLSLSEIDILVELQNMGIHTIIQRVPSETELSFNDIIQSSSFRR